MKKERIFKYILGIGVFAITAALIIAIFVTIFATPNLEKSLIDTKNESHGWSYSVLSDGKCINAEPQFSDEYTMYFNESNITAIKKERIMTETFTDALCNLRFSTQGIGTEIFIDDTLLFSNLELNEYERDENGFLNIPYDYIVTNNNVLDNTVALQSDFVGKTLTVINYFNKDSEFIFSSNILLGTDNQITAPLIIDTIGPLSTIIISAILALLLSGFFLYDIVNKKQMYRSIFLILFFLMLIVMNTYSAFASSCAFGEWGDFSFIGKFCIIPLFLYVASSYTKWRKYTTFGISLLVFFYYLITAIIQSVNDGFISPPDNYAVYAAAFLLFIIISIFELFSSNQKIKKYFNVKNNIFFVLAILCGTALYCYKSDVVPTEFFRNTFGSMGYYYFQPICNWLTTIFAIIATISIIVEFVSELIKQKKTISVLNERSRYAEQSYQMLLVGEKETKAARHEMSHHMNAISALLEENKTDRAKEYIYSVAENLRKLPKLRYCNNLLVNSVVGAYVEQAQNENIEIVCNINISETIGVADKDLCVFLENMLDNAIEACKKIKNGKKQIEIDINYKGSFLYVGCENSCTDKIVFDENNMPVTSKSDSKNHGYGITAMKMIAEKYNSILIIQCKNNKFSVKTSLNCADNNGEEQENV